MSPSEFDLRAALRDGEDDGLDVDGLVASVRARRAQRRTRVLSTAAAVVVVAAAAVGGAAVWGGSDGGGGPQAGSTATTSLRPSQSFDGSPEPAGTDTAVPVRSCPSAYPARSAPGGGLSAAAAGPMFDAPVASVQICAFTQTGSVTGATAAPLVLTGAKATALADSIENASKSKLKILCPDIVASEKKQLAIIATTSGGTQLPTVTTDVSIPNCNEPITNGSAVRYAWKPPASVASLIGALTTRTGRSLPTPSGGSGVNGSPAR